jgi:hypothetical protein
MVISRTLGRALAGAPPEVQLAPLSSSAISAAATHAGRTRRLDLRTTGLIRVGSRH